MTQGQSMQAVTPQLRDWIISQAQAGFAAEAVLKSMLDSGWNEDVAIEALETTLRDHLQATQLPDTVRVPQLALDESPLYLELEDCRVSILSHMRDPNIVVIGNFLSDEECDGSLSDRRHPNRW
jgi:prolyl 4-hydroxylase